MRLHGSASRGRRLVNALAVGCLVAAAGAVVPGVGQAARVPLCDQSEVCRVHRENGFQLYEAKNYADALTEFEAAYATRAEPRLLLNIGRSLFRLDRPGEALQRYQQFREQSPALDAATQESLARYITEAEAAKAAQDESHKPLPAPPPKLPSLAAPGVLLGLGGALLASSLGTGLYARQLQQEFSDTSLQTMMFTPELQDLQQRGLTMNQATLGLAIGGGALVIAGATWLGVAIHQRKVIQSANTSR